MEPRVRRAVAGDAEALAELRLALQREEGLVGDDVPLDRLREAHRAYFAARIPAGEFLAWVAEADRQIVATSGLVISHHPPRPRNLSGVEAYVMNMYTHPAWRRRGLASALLDALLRHVAATPAGRIWFHASPAAVSLYARHGFRPRTTFGTEMELLLPATRLAAGDFGHDLETESETR